MNFVFMIIVFGCAAYSVAVTKGKNPYLWFAIGLVIGPIAVLILAFFPTKSKAERSKPESETLTEVE
jgi:uncharacterized membrane protein YedE/YeeE